MKTNKSLLDMAIVPLASPLIAGPATITATIVKASQFTPGFVSIALFFAIMINMIICFYSLRLQSILSKYNLMGALIRITGLFIMSMGMNMILVAVNSFRIL